MQHMGVTTVGTVYWPNRLIKFSPGQVVVPSLGAAAASGTAAASGRDSNPALTLTVTCTHIITMRFTCSSLLMLLLATLAACVPAPQDTATSSTAPTDSSDASKISDRPEHGFYSPETILKMSRDCLNSGLLFTNDDSSSAW